MLAKKKIYYLIYEVEYRDLLQRLFISLSVTQKNSYVLLMTFKKFRKIYNFLPKGVVVFQNLGFAKKEICEKILVRHKGCLLHEEPFQIYEDYINPSVVYDKELLNKMEFISCISEEHKKIIDNFCKNKAKTIVHGFPKMELSGKNYKYLFEENIQKIKRQYKDIIFIPSNFHFSSYRLNNNDKNWYDQKINTYKNNINSNHLKKYIQRDIQINKHKTKVLNKYIIAIKALSKIYKNNTFVIRPHPGDHPSFWKKFFIEKNIKVLFEYDVKTWIHSSKLSLNHWCTSSVESYFQKKNVISYLPFYNKNLDNQFYSNLYEKAYNFNDLKKLIGKRLKKEKKYKKGLTKKYIKNTNQSSINLVSNSLKQIDIQKSGIFFSWILIKFFSIYLLLDDLLKPNFRKEKESFKWPNKSSSYFKKILKKNKFTNQKIREIGPGIYLIA
jgi:surface carbohydrate biosynthesis protein